MVVRALIIGTSLIVAAASTAGMLGGAFISPFAAVLAHAAVFVLDTMSIPATLDGAVIDTNGFAVVIAPVCTGIEVTILFCAAVLVYPAALRARLWGILLGILALAALNFVRIVSLLLIGVMFPEHFDTSHLIIWQLVMVMAAIGLWLLWQSWASRGVFNKQ